MGIISPAQASLEYLKAKKNYCEHCLLPAFVMIGDYQKKNRLTIHHKDHNHSNDDPDNLQTLCRKCHDKVHNM